MIRRTVTRVCMLMLLVCSFGTLGWSTRAESQSLPARVFTVAPNNEIHMATGGASWCVEVEAVSNDFDVSNVDACTVVLISPGTGSVSQISYDCTKTTVIGDADGNGLQDIRFCFLKTAMQPLFDGLHGRQPKTVTLFVQGSLTTGGSFSGSTTAVLYLKD